MQNAACVGVAQGSALSACPPSRSACGTRLRLVLPPSRASRRTRTARLRLVRRVERRLRGSRGRNVRNLRFDGFPLLAFSREDRDKFVFAPGRERHCRPLPQKCHCGFRPKTKVTVTSKVTVTLPRLHRRFDDAARNGRFCCKINLKANPPNAGRLLLTPDCHQAPYTSLRKQML